MRWAMPRLLAATLLLSGTACSEGDTIIVSPDCGLIRTDLEGTWDVTYPSVGTTLFNCSDPFFDGKTLSPPFAVPGTVSFTDVAVFASGGNVGFFFHDTTSPQLLFGNAEADTCMMLYSLRVAASATDSTPLYLQCLGTFNIGSSVVGASCDSATVLEDPLSDPPVILADCDLGPIVTSAILVK